MFELADTGMGGVHHLTDLQVPDTVLTGGYLGVERFAAKVSGRHSGPLFIGEDGVELDRVKLGEVESPFFHPTQHRGAGVFVEGCAHKRPLSGYGWINRFPNATAPEDGVAALRVPLNGSWRSPAGAAPRIEQTPDVFTASVSTTVRQERQTESVYIRVVTESGLRVRQKGFVTNPATGGNWPARPASQRLSQPINSLLIHPGATCPRLNSTPNCNPTGRCTILRWACCQAASAICSACRRTPRRRITGGRRA